MSLPEAILSTFMLDPIPPNFKLLAPLFPGSFYFTLTGSFLSAHELAAITPSLKKPNLPLALCILPGTTPIPYSLFSKKNPQNSCLWVIISMFSLPILLSVYPLYLAEVALVEVTMTSDCQIQWLILHPHLTCLILSLLFSWRSFFIWLLDTTAFIIILPHPLFLTQFRLLDHLSLPSLSVEVGDGLVLSDSLDFPCSLGSVIHSSFNCMLMTSQIISSLTFFLSRVLEPVVF